MIIEGTTSGGSNISHITFNGLDCDPIKGRWIAKRVTHEPIIHAGLHSSIGENIQGPSLIRVPAWVTNPLGRYYLYFADHKGSFIRLAYADELVGPWRIHEAGSLHLEESQFPTEPQQPPPDFEPRQSAAQPKLLHSAAYEGSTPHIASPDVHVKDEERRIFMYFHGLASFGVQRTRLATSRDGINFVAEEPLLCNSYLRVVPFDGKYFGVVMPGTVYVMDDERGPFEVGKRLFTTDARHHAILRNHGRAFVFWTQVGEAPERIKVSVFELTDDLESIQINHLNDILKPELAWEGADAPNEPSVRSVAYGCVNQLRDPCVFVEDGRIFLLYAGGGESAIGIAELHWEEFE